MHSKKRCIIRIRIKESVCYLYASRNYFFTTPCICTFRKIYILYMR